jgi:hypothetical protein
MNKWGKYIKNIINLFYPIIIAILTQSVNYQTTHQHALNLIF